MKILLTIIFGLLLPLIVSCGGDDDGESQSQQIIYYNWVGLLYNGSFTTSDSNSGIGLDLKINSNLIP